MPPLPRIIPSMTSTVPSHLDHSMASRDLSREWRSCCLRAGGWDEDVLDAPREVTADAAAVPKVTLLNLVNMEDYKRAATSEEEKEGWVDALKEIETNLNRMIAWLQEKQWAYVSVETPDEEASLIQSTIASYTASTANELEELRSVLFARQRQEFAVRPQAFEHQSIMVQAMLQRLKEQVAEPFGKLQKLRHREAVQIWQNPLSVKVYVPSAQDVDEMDAALGIARDQPTSDYSFHPKLPRLALQQNFLDSYQEIKAEPPLEPPTSIFTNRPKRVTASPPSPTAKPAEKRFKPPAAENLGFAKPTGTVRQPQDQPTSTMYAEPEELQQEAVLLKASLENDLDQVQKMETTMVNITQLLSQFADLVASQQEDIVQIHDAAETTKENMEKGQEKLLDAADRSRQSSHYMATAITAMGVMLLVIHWIRP